MDQVRTFLLEVQFVLIDWANKGRHPTAATEFRI